MKRKLTWLLAGLAVVLLAAGAWRGLAARQAQQQSLQAARAERAAAPLLVTQSELVTVQRQTLASEIPVSGTVRAVDSAWVKARTAGELQSLVLREGDSVQKGAVVARIDPTEVQARVRQAQQQAGAARAQVDISQRQFDNNRALVAQGFISATALVTSQATLESAQATYEAALAAVEVARKALDDSTLRSPITGQVSQRVAQPGERLPIDGRVLEIVDLRQLELEALLPPADALAVKAGQQALLRIEGYPSPVAATVARISPAVQAGSRSTPVYLLIQQPAQAPAVRQGQFAQGHIQTGQIQTLAVPLDIVRNDRPVPYVQALIDGRITYLPVKTGQRSSVNGKTWVAVDGLPEGTAVTSAQLGSLREGTAVAVAPAAAAQPRTAP